MPFITTIGQGWIKRIDAAEPTGRAGGARVVVTRDGSLQCSFVTQSCLGVNDFVPTLATSTDGGATWKNERSIWPDLAEGWSILVSISAAPDGRLFLFGSRTRIDEPGEPFWSDRTQGLKDNELIWSCSEDDGRTWCDPQPIPMPVPGSAEAPGPMCVTRGGAMLCCYCAYPTFDPAVRVDRRDVTVLVSTDEGRTWRHATMLRVAGADSGTADARIVELADGRLLGTVWHLDLNDNADHLIACAVGDDPLRWPETGATDIVGQSQHVAPLPDGRVLIAFTDRKHAEPGIHAALLRFDEGRCVTVDRDIACRVRQEKSERVATEHSEWTDFAFGGPCIARVEDDVALITYWVHQHDGRGVRFVRVRFES